MQINASYGGGQKKETLSANDQGGRARSGWPKREGVGEEKVGA